MMKCETRPESRSSLQGSLGLWVWTTLPFFYAFCATVIGVVVLLTGNSQNELLSRPVQMIFFTVVSGVLALPICAGIRTRLLRSESLSPQARERHKRVYILGILIYIFAFLFALWRIMQVSEFD